MFLYRKEEIEQLAQKYNFRKETLEKELRLIEILKFINNNGLTKNKLVLKGGTAINFCVFDLPRLSVDIDLDYEDDVNRDIMIKYKEKVENLFIHYMQNKNYNLSSNTRYKYALTSLVFQYENLFGGPDSLKIEINYMNRIHIYPFVMKNVNIPTLEKLNICALDNLELFGTKIKALIERTTIRDVYDVYQMLMQKVFKEDQYDKLKKCVLFYLEAGHTGSDNFNFKETIDNFNFKIENFTKKSMPQYLTSVLRKSDNFDIKRSVQKVKEFVNKLMVLKDEEKEFINEFNLGNCKAELLYNDESMVNKLNNHPMVIWKCKRISKDIEEI